MKKLITTVAVLACAASIVSAQTVTSANIVGYSKVTLEPGFSIVRTPFLAGGQDEVSLQDVFDTSLLNQAANAGFADNILFWDAIGLKYDLYYLHDGSGKNNAAKAGKWVDSMGVISTKTVPPETSIFYTLKGVASIEVMTVGEAVTPLTGTNSLALLTGFNLIANPFTSEWKLNDGSVDWIGEGAVAAANAGFSDNIVFWDLDNLKYDTYFLHDGSGKNNAAKAGKWVDSATQTVDANLSVGLNEGVFYTRQAGAGSVSIDVAQPYDL